MLQFKLKTVEELLDGGCKRFLNGYIQGDNAGIAVTDYMLTVLGTKSHYTDKRFGGEWIFIYHGAMWYIEPWMCSVFNVKEEE